MKKSTIKRRKRVVPALSDQGPEASGAQTVPPTSVSPDTSPAATEQQLLQSRPPNINFDGSISLGLRPRNRSSDRQYEAIPTDFTGFGRPPSMSPDTHSQERMRNLRFSSPYNPPMPIPPLQTSPAAQSSKSETTRKRSFAAAEGTTGLDPTLDSARPNRLSSISSILNPAQQPSSKSTDDTGMDTSYPRSSSSQPQRRNPPYSAMPTPEQRWRSLDYEDPGGAAVTDLERSTRKAKLKREADAMRLMLEAKEKELQELDGEG